MKLTDYIPNAGRVVAYYPKLKKLTGSTNATILLCQLLYWTDKVDDGRVFKDSYDIEEETGLTYHEQKTARNILLDLGLTEETYHRLDHKIEFIINQDEFRQQWEECTGEIVGEIKKKEKESTEDLKKRLKQAEEEAEEIRKEKEAKKKDPTDWIKDALGKNNPVLEKTNKKEEIRNKIEDKFNIIANDHRWGKFIDFAYVRETKHEQPVDTFLSWALHEGFDPMYWTPEKCKMIYPRAFASEKKNLPENFVKNLPDMKEKEYAPMPDSIKNRPDLGFKKE